MTIDRKRTWVLALVLVAVLGTGALAEEEKPEGAWLGVRLSGPATPERGVRVSRVFEGSPADRAGLRGSDVILDLGGEPVSGIRDLIAKIGAREPGAWIDFTVLRQGDEINLDVRLAARPEVIDQRGVRRGWIGLEAIELPESLRAHFGAPPGAGVMISEVVASSPAESAGFRLGDVVYEVGEKPVGSRRALRERIEGGGVGNEYEFSVARDGALLVLEARLEAAPPPDR
jgi:serine protease Do